MKELEKKQRAAIFGRNVRSQRLKAGLTIAGAAAAFRLSYNHFRLIERGETNIRAKNAKVIADFFNTDTATLYAPAPPPVKDIEEIPAIKEFREVNKDNYQFFISLRDEKSVASFLRNILLTKKKYFHKDKRDVDAVVSESGRKEYKKNFNSKEVSRELIRLFNRGELDRRPKTDTRKRFWYFVPGSPASSSFPN